MDESLKHRSVKRETRAVCKWRRKKKGKIETSCEIRCFYTWNASVERGMYDDWLFSRFQVFQSAVVVPSTLSVL